MDPTTKDLLTYAACGGVFALIARSLGGGWITTLAAGAGGVALGAFVVQQQASGAIASNTPPATTGSIPSQLNPQLG